MESPIIKLMILAVVMDTCFSFIRAMKEHKINSGFGIDGAIRKISMLASIAFLLLFDRIVHLNLIGFIPRSGEGISTSGQYWRG
jgi:toxin secretion/phage lysis holin